MKYQKGIATLITAIVALLVMSITAFFLNRSTIAEIINTQNQIASSKSLEAAEAGINFVLAQLNDDTARPTIMCGSLFLNNINAACTSTNKTTTFNIAETNLSNSGMAYSVVLTRANDNAPIIITSVGGKSGCLTGVLCNKKTIVTQLSNTPFFTKMPPDAVSTPGDVALTGSICVQNSSGNNGYAVRAGTGVSTTNNLQGSGCAASNGNGIFGAVSTIDKSLAAMNGTFPNPMPGNASQQPNYFEYLFGKPASAVFAEADTVLKSGSPNLSTFANNGNNCTKTCGKIIWIETQAQADNMGNGDFGSVDEPVIISVNG